MLRNLTNFGRKVLAFSVIGMAVVAGTGCDDGAYGDYGYYDTGYYGGGYGPIDEDVFQAAADGWSDYIRS